MIPLHQRRSLGNIAASLAMVDDPEFSPVIGSIDVTSDSEALVAELTEIFSRGYLANAHDVLTTIVFIHGVTSPAAIGGMIPYRETTALSALSNAGQPGCTLYACFSTSAMTGRPSRARRTLRRRSIALSPMATSVIKFTEAWLRRDALVPSPAYRAAVDQALGTMRRR